MGGSKSQTSPINDDEDDDDNNDHGDNDYDVDNKILKLPIRLQVLAVTIIEYLEIKNLFTMLTSILTAFPAKINQKCHKY